MNNYTIYCTPEQTKKALELGAPIEFEVECPVNLETLERSPYPEIKMGKDGEPILIIPTAEQMLGWLNEQGVQITTHVNAFGEWKTHLFDTSSVELIEDSGWRKSRKVAIIVAIDEALKYLSKAKEE